MTIFQYLDKTSLRCIENPRRCYTASQDGRDKKCGVYAIAFLHLVKILAGKIPRRMK